MWGLTKKNFKWNMLALVALTALTAAWSYLSHALFALFALLVVCIVLVIISRHFTAQETGMTRPSREHRSQRPPPQRRDGAPASATKCCTRTPA